MIIWRCENCLRLFNYQHSVLQHIKKYHTDNEIDVYQKLVLEIKDSKVFHKERK